MDAYEIRELVPSIAYARLFYEYGKLDGLISLGYDEPTQNYFELFYEALGFAADAVWSDYLEDWGVEAWYFSNKSMMEYYRLCRVYGGAHHMKLKDNPYVLEAQRFVENAMDLDNQNGYDWWLNTKINHKWAGGLVLRTDEMFYGEFELIAALLEIQDWYEKAVYRLRGKLLEERVLRLIALPAHKEVNAA